MQVTAAGFTAEERDTTRKIAATMGVSWKKQFSSNYHPFTIGVSTIGGADTIASSDAIVSNWNNYIYFNESQYLTSLAWERGLKMPTGGLSMGMFEAELDNTSGRFTPRYMGGSSELFTSAQKVMRPAIINAGFNYNGVDQLIPQFVGLNQRSPQVDIRSKSFKFSGFDFVSYLQNSYLDHQVMFTAQRTDQVLGSILTDLGYSTAQYDLDYGINIIPFGLFETGSRFSDVIDKLVEAENGQFYQDEHGRLRFENRQHWDNSPYNTVQRVITTAMVIDAETPSDDHLINVVEITGSVIEKQPNQLVWKLGSPILLAASTTYDLFVDFDNPMLSLDAPSFYLVNTQLDGGGIDVTSSVTIAKTTKFAKSAKITFNNTYATGVYLTDMTLYGRSAKKTSDVYTRLQDDSSVTAYQPRPFNLDNEYIQSQDWANSYAQMVLNDFSEPENLQKITIRAIPDLQLGDLVSWQGRYWRLFDVKTTLNPSNGFTQELTMLQRTVTTYFRIGISTIGGSDKIAP